MPVYQRIGRTEQALGININSTTAQTAPTLVPVYWYTQYTGTYWYHPKIYVPIVTQVLN